MESDSIEFLRFTLRDELMMLARVLIGGLAGAIVGWERGYSGHRAGVRTLTLVAMGSATFTVVSIFGFGDRGSFDPSRVAAQVASGIGFIGAGTIVLLGRTVRGLTTAAAIWVTAALGMAAGVGLYVLVIGIALITTVVLRLLPTVLPDQEQHAADGGNGPNDGTDGAGRRT